MRGQVFVIIFLISFTFVSRSVCALCISRKGRRELLMDMRHRCNRMGLPRPICICLLGHARSVKPVANPFHAQRLCFEQSMFLTEVYKAIPRCYKISTKAVENNSKKGNLAKKFGSGIDLSFEGFSTSSCSCRSGCHYCCILRSIGGIDYCPTCSSGLRCT